MVILNCIEWIFSGIGTAILSGLAGLVVGGFAGYRIGIRNKAKQKQKAGNNSNQTQIGNITNNGIK